MKSQWIASFVVVGLGLVVTCARTAAIEQSGAHGPEHETIVTSRASDVDLPLPAEDDAFVFVVFGDRTNGPPEGVRILERAVKDTNVLDPDLVMTVGDLVEGYNERPEWIEQMREFRSIMDGLTMPWFPVAGNHDVYWRGEHRPREEHESDYEAHFGPLWYAFEHKDCWFIALYSDEGNPETGERNFNKPECQVMSDEQFSWLRETLHHARDARHVFVFLHHPRWLGRNYGDDWERVHAAMVDAGNVTAVFAGHLHYMRYDGERDGIEYVTLATVGGTQTGEVPEAGFLHQFHVVTVRDERISMASLPVGEVMDVRAITGDLAEETWALAQSRPSFPTRIELHADGSLDGRCRVVVSNPVSRPISVTMIAESDDTRWRFFPDHQHVVLLPGESTDFFFGASRRAAVVDETFRQAELRLEVEYLARSARFAIPASRSSLPLNVDALRPPPSPTETAVALDGLDDCLRVPSDRIPLPDGPMTLECWFKADSFGERTGLVAKTENSEYGIFVNNGAPAFYILLGDGYVQAKAEQPMLESGQWHHIAGVYDGSATRLYVDGHLETIVPGSGARRTNGLPLCIGADVNGQGKPMSHFKGAIDAVRLSDTARYTVDAFKPVRRQETDAHTLLLLNMDGLVGPWAFDESPRGAHAERVGDPRMIAVD